MRTFAALAAVATAALLLLPGCPLAACGAFDGAGDQNLRSTSGDAIILCENGGFAATLANGTIYEGRAFAQYDAETGTSTWQLADGESGNELMALTFDDGTGTYHASAIGTDFTAVTLDQVERDHAHVQCDDLALRTWW